MSLQLRLSAVIKQIATDIKALRTADGDVGALTTTTKNLAGAINEINAALSTAGVSIDDTKGDGATTVTWSADKIFDTIEAAKAAVKNDLIAGAPKALDTLKELADALNSDASFASTLAGQMNNKVDFSTPQTLTAAQKLQACQNIGIGNPETDLLTLYTGTRDSTTIMQ